MGLLSDLISQLQSRESAGRTWEMWSAACEWPLCSGGTEQILNSNWSEWPGQGSTVEHCQGAAESRGLPISFPGTPGISSSYCFLRLPGVLSLYSPIVHESKIPTRAGAAPDS